MDASIAPDAQTGNTLRRTVAEKLSVSLTAWGIPRVAAVLFVELDGMYHSALFEYPVLATEALINNMDHVFRIPDNPEDDCRRYAVMLVEEEGCVELAGQVGATDENVIIIGLAQLRTLAIMYKHYTGQDPQEVFIQAFLARLRGLAAMADVELPGHLAALPEAEADIVVEGSLEELRGDLERFFADPRFAEPQFFARLALDPDLCDFGDGDEDD